MSSLAELSTTSEYDSWAKKKLNRPHKLVNFECHPKNITSIVLTKKKIL